MLRYKADRRAVAYILITSALLIIQWNLSDFQPLLYIWALFMSVSVAVMAHNHNHVRMWKSKIFNSLTDYWITIFYGFPAFAWIPTHNANHHKFNNRKGDYTLTYRYTEKNNLMTLVSYPSISGYHQQQPIYDYIKHGWTSKRSVFWYCISQYTILALFIGIALWLDWKKALVFVIIPQQVSLFSVLIFNYVQHVHADEESKYNHSRNIVGPWLNRLLFNNGLHTVHHETPGLHWSKLREAHDKIADQIDPVLNERSFWWFIIRTYFLSFFISRFRSISMRVERMKRSPAV